MESYGRIQTGEIPRAKLTVVPGTFDDNLAGFRARATLSR